MEKQNQDKFVSSDVFHAVVDGSTAIADSEDETVFPVTFAREGVQHYPIGNVLREGEELKNSAFTFEGAFLTLGKHPANTLITRPEEISGRLWHVRFNGDAKDPDGNLSPTLSGEAHISKKPLHPNGKVDLTLIDEMKNGLKRDVSVGFNTLWVRKKGEWNGKPYEFVQKSILGNHVAVGLPIGRTRYPYLGIGADSMSIAEIEAKITELQNQRDDTNTQMDAVYEQQWEQLGKIEQSVADKKAAIDKRVESERAAVRESTTNQIKDLRNRLDNVTFELQAFREAKVRLEIASAGTGNDSGDAPPKTEEETKPPAENEPSIVLEKTTSSPKDVMDLYKKLNR
jgi:hypothetical protein